MLSRRFLMMFYMLLAPEVVIIWARQQWEAAREIAHRNEVRGWTRSHAFFALMGGFMLYEDGTMSRVLSPDELEHLFADGRINWPVISGKEIEDRSKSDTFSKGFAILQTTWFVTQCVVRGVYRLPLSHLEIVAVAFAGMNAVVYFLWWNKPKDVECPVPVHLLPPLTSRSSSKQETRIQPGDQYHSEADKNDSQLLSLKLPVFVSGTGPNDTVGPQFPTNPELESDLPDTHSSILLQTFDLATPETLPIDTVDQRSAPKLKIESNLPEPHPSIPLRPSPTPARVWSYIWNKSLVMGPFVILYLIIYKPVVSIWSDLGRMVTCDTVDNHRNTQSVPTFYAPNCKKVGPSMTIGFVIGTLFGGIHCIAWSFLFSSIKEQHLWRISAVTIASAPPICFLIGISLISGPHLIGVILTCFVLLAYTVARVILLILPFLALRSLPSDSFTTVDWVTSIPHI